MPSTNKTDKLKLSQFEATDKPSFMQDYNADMRIIDTAIRDESRTVADMTDEITGIKNRLDASNTVYNYFTWSGNAHRYVTPGDEESFAIGNPSQGGLGGNAIIDLVSEQTVTVHQDGIYAIWSSVDVGRFSGGLDAPVALSLMYHMSDGPHRIYGNFVKPLTTESDSPTMQLEQSLSLPPTVVSLRSGVTIILGVLAYSDPNNPPESGHTPIEVYQFGAATGIVKIR